jgi:hypothetical protein
MNGDKRYHAEVKIELEGRECRINAFRDTLQEIFQDIGTICSQFPQDWMNPAKREIVNAERKAAQLGLQPGAKAPVKAEETGEIPVCEQCGRSNSMELIKFTDKKTGKPAQAWKCQACIKWHFENGKKK